MIHTNEFERLTLSMLRLLLMYAYKANTKDSTLEIYQDDIITVNRAIDNYTAFLNKEEGIPHSPISHHAILFPTEGSKKSDVIRFNQYTLVG